MTELEETVLEELYTWIDQIPLSRPKRDLKRDFSDGVLVAEVVKHFIPNFVELHNYSSALAINKKFVNWNILNRKVFRKLGFEVNDDVVKNIVNCQPFAIEQFLLLLRKKIEKTSPRRAKSDKPEADQDDMASPRDSRARKTASSHPIITPYRVKTTVAKTSESDSNSPGHVTTPAGIMTSYKTIGGSPRSLTGDAQMKEILEERDAQLKTKDETIEIMQTKIHRLEQLLQLKDIRIEDLQTRLNEARAVGAVRTKKTMPQRA